MIPLGCPDLSGNELKYVTQAVQSGWLTHHGEFEGRFERALSERIGSPVIATSSGTAALHLALLSLGVGPGDEVIVPNLTFGATAAVVARCGAKPALVDIDDSWGINWDHVKMRLTKRVRAVIPVHLYGEECHIPDSFPVPIVEDSCEATWLPRKGMFAAYSFYGNKPITTGEGGALAGEVSMARKIRDGGFTPEYDMEVPGLNYRMTNLQAAVGLAQMERFDELVSRRLRNAEAYAERIKGRGKWLYVADVESPIATAQALRERGYETRPVFRPLHMTRAFRTDGKFKKSVAVWERGLCLPTGPHINEKNIDEICEVVTGVDLHIRTANKRSCELAA